MRRVSPPSPISGLARSPWPKQRHYGGSTFYRIMVGTTNVSAFGIAVGMMAMTPRYLAPLGQPDALGFRLDQQTARGVPLRDSWSPTRSSRYPGRQRPLGIDPGTCSPSPACA